MAKKKKISTNDIISLYMEYVLENNREPKSVYSFAKENKFEESEFYAHFPSFKVLEQSIFKAFFDHTHDVLEKSGDYQNFDARNKLLTFYYTFFENLTANRSYVVYALEKQKDHLKSLASLSKLRKSFTEYVASLDIETLDFKNENIDKIQHRGIKESAWVQLLITIKFWLDDSSASFEKTDIFIEKSVNTSFDIIDTAPIKSIIDLGKFLFKEKMHMN